MWIIFRKNKKLNVTDKDLLKDKIANGSEKYNKA